jgi:hypothetical protein
MAGRRCSAPDGKVPLAHKHLDLWTSGDVTVSEGVLALKVGAAGGGVVGGRVPALVWYLFLVAGCWCHGPWPPCRHIPPPCNAPCPQRCIGRGAHGHVFEAETPDGRTLAVKVTSVDDVHSGREVAAVRGATLAVVWSGLQPPKKQVTPTLGRGP